MLASKLDKLIHDPLFCSKYAFRLVRKKINGTPTGIREKTINGIRFEIEFPGSPDADYYRDMYAGLYALEVTELMKKYLHAGSTFIDIGANVGYVSCIGAGLVGDRGQVHAFEPVPEYFLRLQRLKELNPNFPFYLNNFALGSAEETKTIYLNRANIGNNSFVKNAIDETLIKDEIPIRVRRFDRYAEEKGLDAIGLVKIDVEGFEFEVLKGMEGIFGREGKRPVIICELTPTAYNSMGYTTGDVMKFLRDYGYIPHDIYNPKKEVRTEDVQGMRDVVLIPKSR
jgi:FkbM family methyltransferase